MRFCLDRFTMKPVWMRFCLDRFTMKPVWMRFCLDRFTMKPVWMRLCLLNRFTMKPVWMRFCLDRFTMKPVWMRFCLDRFHCTIFQLITFKPDSPWSMQLLTLIAMWLLILLNMWLLILLNIWLLTASLNLLYWRNCQSLFFYIYMYIYTGEKTIYTVILTKLLHIVNDRFFIPNKKNFSYMIMARTSYIRYMIIMSSLSLLFLESTSYHTRVGHCPCIWEVIIRFADIGGIINHKCLKFFSITCNKCLLLENI
jgi:hypothetical protein